MRPQQPLTLLFAVLIGSFTGHLRAENQSARTWPVHALTPVAIGSVKVEDGFWSPKLGRWRGTTINDAFGKFERYGGFENFDRVARKKMGGHKGEPWWDGLIYETITAGADFLAAHPEDKALRARIDGYVDRISAAAAADPDGYVNTGATLDNIGIKWRNPPAAGDKHDDNWPHTVYNAGCLMEAAVHLYRATGDTKLLKVAVRMANYMTGIMGPPPKQNIIPGHAIGERSFLELAQLFRENPALKTELGMPVDEAAYRALAEFWIENRGNTQGRASAGAYNQDDKPVLAQATMEGHAVRSALLAAGVATAARINGRSDYLATGERWWENMVEGKMYVTGGLGAVPSIEGFGPDYELPNVGYAETCAAVAGGFFSEQMNLATGDAKYVDVLERELYNGALAGASLEGTTYFYTNFLSSGPDHRRWEWAGGGLTWTPCCPPMFLKLQGALPGMIYATDADGIYVNLFIGSTARIKWPGAAKEVILTQTTNYPWDGNAKLTVKSEAAANFTLNLRVPAWAGAAQIRVNGEIVKSPPVVRGYASLKREWREGDTVEVTFPLVVKRVKADPRVKADVGRVALMRGPIVYCLEGLDNGGVLQGILIPSKGPITAEFRPKFLDGVTVLKGEGTRIRSVDGATKAAPMTFTAIPFYANSNREPTFMEVWIPDDPAVVTPLTLAGEAIASASHCYSEDSVTAINDGLFPKNSADESIPRLTWWDHRGTEEWAQLTFQTPRRLSGAEIYWWDETRVKRDCRVPQSWQLEYQRNGEWQPVQASGQFGTRADSFNRVNFAPVETTAVRVRVKLQPGWSGGILEWRLF